MPSGSRSRRPWHPAPGGAVARYVIIVRWWRASFTTTGPDSVAGPAGSGRSVADGVEARQAVQQPQALGQHLGSPQQGLHCRLSVLQHAQTPAVPGHPVRQGWPPDGGMFDDVVPHLSIGQDVTDVDLATLRAFLPVRAEVHRASITRWSPESIETLATLPLSGRLALDGTPRTGPGRASSNTREWLRE